MLSGCRIFFGLKVMFYAQAVSNFVVYTLKIKKIIAAELLYLGSRQFLKACPNSHTKAKDFRAFLLMLLPPRALMVIRFSNFL